MRPYPTDIRMTYDRSKHRRRSIRLPAYDYASAGAYFVTVVCKNRECLLGEVVDGAMRLSEAGELAYNEWLRSVEIRSEMDLDAFVVMPNHIHGIIVIRDVGAHGHAPLPAVRRRQRPARSLGSFVARYKGAVTRRINELRGTPGAPVWQRNYYEHVIRDDDDLTRVRRYVAENPLRWSEDLENPDAVGAVREPPLRDTLFDQRGLLE